MKCKLCGKEIEKGKEIKIMQKCYVHEECKNEYILKNKSNIDYDELKNYIYTVLFDKDAPTYVWIQIQQMYKNKDYKFTYKGMLLTLKYYYEVLGNYFNKSKGIGIIPYKYDEAREYWIKMNKVKNKIKDFKSETKINEIITSMNDDRKIYKDIDMKNLFE
jgi:hypothetical protein